MTLSTNLPAAPVDGGEVAPERAAAIQGLESSFGELVVVFRRHLSAAAEIASPGMLPGTFKVLSTVHRTGPLTLSSLTERLSADKGMLSRSVSELEALGFVERTADPADRRARLIAVTPLGEERLEAARGPHSGRLFAALEDWPIADIEHVTALLHTLAAGGDRPAAD